MYPWISTNGYHSLNALLPETKLLFLLLIQLSENHVRQKGIPEYHFQAHLLHQAYALVTIMLNTE